MYRVGIGRRGSLTTKLSFISWNRLHDVIFEIHTHTFGYGGVQPPPSEISKFWQSWAEIVIKYQELRKFYCMKFLIPNYSCLQNPWLGGLPPPDPQSLCPLSSTEFVEPPSEQNSWVGHCARTHTHTHRHTTHTHTHHTNHTHITHTHTHTHTTHHTHTHTHTPHTHTPHTPTHTHTPHTHTPQTHTHTHTPYTHTQHPS
jgi:hypothetical protein